MGVIGGWSSFEDGHEIKTHEIRPFDKLYDVSRPENVPELACARQIRKWEFRKADIGRSENGFRTFGSRTFSENPKSDFGFLKVHFPKFRLSKNQISKPKISQNKIFRRQQMNFCKSSETRFGKV